MKIALLTIATILFFISCNNEKSDAQIDKEIEQYRDSTRQQNNYDSLFISRNMKQFTLVEEKKDCNLLVHHYVVSGISDNVDTLKKCAEILTMSLFSEIIEQDCNGVKPRAGIFLYTSQKKYRITANFAAYSLNTGKAVTGFFTERNLK